MIEGIAAEVARNVHLFIIKTKRLIKMAIDVASRAGCCCDSLRWRSRGRRSVREEG